MIRALTIDLEGQVGKVYRNLKNGLWSILFKMGDKEWVVAHVATVNLVNVTFQVREAGWLRVVHERRKNIHAFAQGTYMAANSAPATAISYNPYQAGHFYCEANRQPIYSASHVRLAGVQAFATLNGLF